MLRTARNSVGLIALMLVALVGASIARSAPAPLWLDPTFGSGGVVSSGHVSGYEEPAALAVGPNGEVFVAAEGPTAEDAVVVARYRPDGVLDTSFGASGHLVVTGVGPVNALTPAPSGGVLLLSRHQVITRITQNGRLDRSFGEDGSVEMGQAGIDRPSFHIWSLATLPDGRIVGAGMSFGAPQMVAIRLLQDGSLDTSFGASGSVGVSFGPKLGSGAFAMKLLPDGKLLLGGYAEHRPALARLLPDGTPDSSFGHNGRVRSPRRMHGEIRALAVWGDGTILAAANGWTRSGRGPRALLLRYNGAGKLDRHFGSIAAPNSRYAPKATPVAVTRARQHLFMVTRGPGPTIRAFHLNGQPLLLGRVPGVPQDLYSHVAAAPQASKLLLAWTPRHAPRQGAVNLSRFRLR